MIKIEIEELSNRILNENEKETLLLKSNEKRELTHYGVKGMKWGVRKEYEPHPRKSAQKSVSSDDSRSVKQPSNKDGSSVKTKTPFNYKKAIAITAGGIGIGVAAYLGYKYIGRDYIRRNFGRKANSGGDTASVLGERFYRNFINKDRDVTLAPGQTFQRITTASNSGYTENVFMSYKNADKDEYKGVLGWMRLRDMAGDPNASEIKLYQTTLTAEKAIKLPSKKTRVSEFKKLCTENPQGVLDFINSHEERKLTKLNLNDSVEFEKTYRKFNNALGIGLGPENKYGDVVREYYSKLGRLGYDAIPDENDIRLSTFKAQAPIIMFDTAKSGLKSTTRELTPGEVLSAYDRSLFSKIGRQVTQGKGTGYEKLVADSKKAAEKYTKQVMKDQTMLNPNYTMANLAFDMTQNTLTSSQIKKLSSLMDKGMSHDEALVEVMGPPDLVMREFLKKANLYRSK